jgi:secretion/DNA translocation related TadE-like protein
LNRVSERGSATLVAVAMMAVLLAIALGGSLVASAVIARHRAQAAADLAALAAARWIGSGPQAACVWAASVAMANRSRLVACTPDGLDVVVTVEVAVVLGRLGVGSARAAARAGPARVPT